MSKAENPIDISRISDNFNNDRYSEVKRLKSFKNELSIVCANTKTLEYYQKIIRDIDIDRTNPNNSYVMWVFDKVDQVDKKNPSKIDPGLVSLPDIDMDFEIHGRARIIDYVRNKYGKEKVSQMITFSRLQGRGALKEVMRVCSDISFEEMNDITEYIPDEAEISDQLQLMKEASVDGEASIIQWALENNSDKLKKWAYIDKETGEIKGTLAEIFKQAIRIEGTKKSQSKHAAGVIISQDNLKEVCPMILDKSSGEYIAGMEMGDLEKMGHVKFDFLGLACLDKIHGIVNLLKFGEL
jgi:DNA polymerase-3 subunit alpha